MIDLVVERLSAWMEVEGRDRADFKAVVTVNPSSPWVLISFVWIVAYDATLPGSYDFAVWRETQAVHRVDDKGAVEDPELFRIST